MNIEIATLLLVVIGIPTAVAFFVIRNRSRIASVSSRCAGPGNDASMFISTGHGHASDAGTGCVAGNAGDSSCGDGGGGGSSGGGD